MICRGAAPYAHKYKGKSVNRNGTKNQIDYSREDISVFYQLISLVGNNQKRNIPRKEYILHDI